MKFIETVLGSAIIFGMWMFFISRGYANVSMTILAGLSIIIAQNIARDK